MEVAAATPIPPTATRDFDLLVLDADGLRNDRIEQMAKWLDERGGIPLLVIADDDALSSLRMPSHSRADFICSGASETELEVRVRRLLGDEDAFSVDDVLRIDNLVINLATYQVYLDDEPVDLTLMEYSLLSFLATHPNPRLQSRGAAASRMGVRVLRRHPYRRRAHPPHPVQGGAPDRRAHHHGPRGRVPVQELTRTGALRAPSFCSALSRRRRPARIDGGSARSTASIPSARRRLRLQGPLAARRTGPSGQPFHAGPLSALKRN